MCWSGINLRDQRQRRRREGGGVEKGGSKKIGRWKMSRGDREWEGGGIGARGTAYI